MKREQIVNSLLKEGFSDKTLVKFNDKQLVHLYERIIGEATTKQVRVLSMNNADDAAEVNNLVNNPKAVADMKAKGHVEVTKEEKNKHSKDLSNKKKDVKEMIRFYDDDGEEIKDKKGKLTPVSSNDKDFDEKVKSKKKTDKKSDELDESITGILISAAIKKLTEKLGREPKHEEIEKELDKMSKQFKKENKPKKDSKELKKESIEIKNWIRNLSENNFHSFTSKGEIMELIQSKTSDVEVGSNVKKGHNGIPEFMTYDSIVSAAEPKEKPSPTKTPTKDPGTKQPPKKDPRKTPFQPGPGQNPKPKALKENK